MNERVLITGASSGIGLALALEFAKNGHALVLSAPVEEEIEEVAARIRKLQGVKVSAIAADLIQEDAAENIFNELQDRELAVTTLVNNAGHGQRGFFSEIPLEREIDIIRLNVEAVVRMTKLFLTPMLERNAGKILNTASIAGFEPGPMLAIYHASKAFVLSFTEALAVELEESGITVTALCPGATDTDFFPKADLMRTRAFQKTKVMAPADVASLGYKALMRGDRVCVAGGMNKAIVASRRFLTVPAQAKFNLKNYSEVPPAQRKRKRGDIEKVKLAKELAR